MPEGEIPTLPDGVEVEDLDEDQFLAFSQKVSLSPVHEESVAASASELLFSELSEKTRLLNLAKKEVEEYKLKYQALLSAPSASQKRQRDAVPPQAAAASCEADEAPKKKHSPEVAKAPEKSPPAGATLSDSDDEVPPPLPDKPTIVATTKARPFEQLNSVLCAYKDKKIVPGSEELPFDICTELCKEEADAVEAWDQSTRKRYHRAVISALRLVYPNKKTSWFQSHFLTSPSGAAKYWVRVLRRRADIWKTAASAAKALHRESLQLRIRRKINERRQTRIKSLSKVSASAANDPFKTPIRESCVGLSSSDSDDEPQKVIDLSQSPALAASKAEEAGAAEASPKMAPAPKYVVKWTT